MQMFGHIHRISVRLYYLIPLHNFHIFQYVCVSKKQVHLSRTCTSLSQFFNNLTLTSKSFPTDYIFDGPKEPNISRIKIWTVCWLDNNIPSLPQEIQ